MFSSESICEDLPRRPDLKFRTLFETFRLAEREATEAIPDGILEGAAEIAVFSPIKVSTAWVNTAASWNRKP
jgi:hypothetical protein